MITKIATSAERERKAVRALVDLSAYFRMDAGSGNTTSKVDPYRVKYLFRLSGAI